MLLTTAMMAKNRNTETGINLFNRQIGKKPNPEKPTRENVG